MFILVNTILLDNFVIKLVAFFLSVAQVDGTLLEEKYIFMSVLSIERYKIVLTKNKHLV